MKIVAASNRGENIMKAGGRNGGGASSDVSWRSFEKPGAEKRQQRNNASYLANSALAAGNRRKPAA
jgi:hypothetical protein